MRFMVIPLLVALLAAGCGSDRPKTAAQQQTPTPTGTNVTFDDLIVAEQELPGCKLDQKGAYVRRAYSQSFNCPTTEERLTEILYVLENTPEAAEAELSRVWSTMDSARDTIRNQLIQRPIDPNSIRVTDAKPTFGPLGAEQEYVYCAAFTDVSGTIRVVMYFGAFRFKMIRVEWTSFAIGGDCGQPLRAQELGRTLAVTQLAKLRAVLPGATQPFLAQDGSPTPTPTRRP